MMKMKMAETDSRAAQSVYSRSASSSTSSSSAHHCGLSGTTAKESNSMQQVGVMQNANHIKSKSFPFISSFISSSNKSSRTPPSPPPPPSRHAESGGKVLTHDANPDYVIRARLSFLFSSTASLLHRKHMEELKGSSGSGFELTSLSPCSVRSASSSNSSHVMPSPSSSRSAKYHRTPTPTTSTRCNSSAHKYHPSHDQHRPTRASTPIPISVSLNCKSFLLVSTVVLLVKVRIRLTSSYSLI